MITIAGGIILAFLVLGIIQAFPRFFGVLIAWLLLLAIGTIGIFLLIIVLGVLRRGY